MPDTQVQRSVQRGRPREFDAGRALDAALLVFWRQGYEGTSIGDLTAAMGINGPSLYAAFGNKESLFRQALARYDHKYGVHFRAALAEPSARFVAERLFVGSVNQVTRRGCPRGCLLVQSAMASNKSTEPVRKAVCRVRAGAETAIRERFERAASEGDLPPDVDPAGLARYVWTVQLGIAVQAAGGASRAKLFEIVKVVMRSWPA